MHELISVAMATYNGERFLKEQLDSLYFQTRIPDEIFVSDDGSQDGTVDILEQYHKKYGLKYVVNKQPLGVNKNFEQAIRSCNGDYIIICDQDDIWFPNKIEKTYNKIKSIEQNKPAVVSSQCFDINQKREIISRRTKIHKDSSKCAETLLQPANCTQGCTLMMNRKLMESLNSFPETDIMLYDCYIGFVGASIGIKYNMSCPLMFYRHHNTNVVGKISEERASFIKRFGINLLNRFQILPIPKGRFEICKYINNEYGDLFTEEVKGTYNALFSYCKSKTFIERVKNIMEMHQLSFNKRIKLILSSIIS